MSSNNSQADYDQAVALKDNGNLAFKKGDLKLALKNYSRVFMHIGMNPCMNMAQMMGQGSPAGKPQPQQSKDPLQQQTDMLRLNAFNNMAAVYSKQGNYEECKKKCARVLTHDPNNIKALFRRAKSYRMLGLYELARADLKKMQTLPSTNPTVINNELKLLKKDEKNADKAFYAKMKKQMRIAQRKKLNKKKKKALREKTRKKAATEEASNNSNHNAQKKKKKTNPNEINIEADDTNENLSQNTEDTEYVWDLPKEQAEAEAEPDADAEAAADADADSGPVEEDVGNNNNSTTDNAITVESINIADAYNNNSNADENQEAIVPAAVPTAAAPAAATTVEATVDTNANASASASASTTIESTAMEAAANDTQAKPVQTQPNTDANTNASANASAANANANANASAANPQIQPTMF